MLADDPPPTGSKNLRRLFGPAARVVECALVLFVLDRLSHGLGYHATIEAVRGTPSNLIFNSILLTVLSYLALIARDWCALSYVGAEVPLSATLFASFCGAALGNIVALGAMSGWGVRERVYGAMNVRPEQTTRLTLFTDVGFGFGLSGFAGLCLMLAGPALNNLPLVRMATLHVAGVTLLLAIAVSTIVCTRKRTPLDIGQVSFSMPTFKIAIAEILVSTVDVAAASAALWILPAPTQIDFLSFSVIFSVAMALGVGSRIPAGLGVFDAFILFGLRNVAAPDSVVAALLV